MPFRSPREASREATQLIAEKLGEFLREIAALVLVFIPLDLWRDRITGGRVVGVLLVCAILFMFGLWFDILAMHIKRLGQEVEE